MKLRYVAAVLLLAAAAIVLLALFAPSEQAPGDASGAQSISVLRLGRAGEYGYASLLVNGTANVTMLAYDSMPRKQVVILNDSSGLGNITPFVQDLMPLSRYGMGVSVSERKVLSDNAVFVVATGALPSYVLDDLLFNATDAVVVYVGSPGLVLDGGGARQEDWYSRLDGAQKSRVVLYGTSPEEFVDANLSLAGSILENSWAVTHRSSALVSGEGRLTRSLPMNGSPYLRIIATVGSRAGLADSGALPRPQVGVEVSPQSLFPWEKFNAAFSLNWTNGTASLSVTKEGREEYGRELGRIREESYFPERMQLTEPGDHVLSIIDNSGVIGGTIIHVRDLRVDYTGSEGVSYIFNVTVDGAPLDNEKATVRLGNSTMEKDFYVSDGVLSVPAQLQQGGNVFSIRLLGTEKDVVVEYSQAGLADIYITYGIPGLLLVAAVYFGARMTRRPVYTLRVGETAGEIRKDVRMPVPTALSLFKSARRELGIGHSPITAHEYSVALKRFVTEGADVTEGNVEEILQRLVRKGFLESYRQHYQLKGEGDVRRNAMVRMIRDKLIQAGTPYRMRGRHFVTDRMEIGFFGDRFGGHAVAVIEDQRELSTLFGGMDAKSLAALRIRMANGSFRFVTLEQLDEVL